MDMALDGVESAHRDLALGPGDRHAAPAQPLPQPPLHPAGGLPAQGVLGYKSYTSNRSGNRFLVHLHDAASGQLRAVVAADYLGMVRTGRPSGVARWLARPDSTMAGVFGAGWQAEACPGHFQPPAAGTGQGFQPQSR